MWKLHFLQHALDTIYIQPPPILILVSFLLRSAFRHQLRCWLQGVVRGVEFDDGGKGGTKPRNHPLCVRMWAVSCIVSRPVLPRYVHLPPTLPWSPAAHRPYRSPSVRPSSSPYRETYFTSLEIQLLICALSSTINSRDRKTNAFFRFLCTYCVAAVCPISMVPAVTAHTVCYGCEI